MFVEAWDRMGSEFEAPFFITQGLPLLQASEHASIINITDSGLDWPDTKYTLLCV